MQIEETYTTNDMSKIDSSKFDGAVGPIEIEGAEPGDSIEVELREVRTGTWGWTAILGDFGLLKGRFQEELIIWDLRDGYATSRTETLKGIRIPLRPFLGVVGTSPPSGEYGMIPPQFFGGNMDNRLLRQGAKLTLTVSVNGAMLSFADPHGAQGDGEVCGTAIETSAEIVAVVKLNRKAAVKVPRLVSEDDSAGKQIVAMGISPDLHRAATEATMEMISILKERGFGGNEAYALCSVAGNLRISEIVDEPNFVVSMLIPEDLLSRK